MSGVNDPLLQDFLAVLGPRLAGRVDSSTLAQALYSSDASLYRVVPAAVAHPRDAGELEALLDAARETGLPVTARGAGTSCAGNAVGSGLVIDLRRHMNRIHAIDAEARTATVDPGVVQESLQRALRDSRLRFGPDPSTSSRCTIGGIIANNACGPRALGYGIAADNIVDADIVTGSGERLRLSDLSGSGYANHRTTAELGALVDANLATIRTEFGRFSRQVSGYSLQHLLPERGRDIVSFFAGTEGTLGVATRLKVRLVADPAHTVTVALGYPSMADAADVVPGLLDLHPTAVEGLDARIVDVVRRKKGPAAVPDMPAGEGWLLIELGGEDAGEVAARAAQLVRRAQALEGWVVDDPGQAARLWKIRSDGAGLAGVSFDKPAYPGWEDAAVPCVSLGAYLREFEALLVEHGMRALPYGHFGEGCVHARIDFPLTEPGGLARYRAFVTDSAKLVAGFGGSLSGEHGDGRARSQLLPLMYSAEALSLFDAVKHIFDPDNRLNPGVIANPQPLDGNVRYTPLVGNTLVRQHRDFSAHVHRCTGVGACVAADPAGVMCPSYQATHNEKDSTRGRARVLQEMLNGSLVHGWDSPEVEAALDLCLACKGCYSDCPTGVDIAGAKSYALHQRYRGKPRPRSHYALGWLPRWGRLITALHLGAPINAILDLPGIGRIAKWAAGVDKRRPLPRFAARSQRERFRFADKRDGSSPRTSGTVPVRGQKEPFQRRAVVVWVDSFTDCFESAALPAMLRVLVDAGYAPRVLQRTACCGLTWITTGQRDGAARQIRAALDQLAPIAATGTPIVGIEPSCMAVWRSDAAELVDDPRVAVVAKAIHTLAELLVKTPTWTPPDLAGHEIVVQPHCHQASVLGFEADSKLLKATGAKVTVVNGCCGLAGNFGVETGHHDTSVAVAATNLLPTLRANPAAIVLADGFSCRKQISDLTSGQAQTMAELLAAHR